MKKLVLVLTFALLFGTYGQAEAPKKGQQETPASGFAITIQLIGMPEGSKIHFNQYKYSKSMFFDTARVDKNGVVMFKNNQLLPPGMYNIASENAIGEQQSLVDLFITEHASQHFSLSMNMKEGLSSLEIKGSPENEAFVDYFHYMIDLQQKGNALQERLQQQENLDSANAINQQLQELMNEMMVKQEDIQRKYKGTTFAVFMQSMQEPDAPEPSISPLSPNPDSVFQAYYANFYKEHFFDAIDFSNPIILNTPVLLNVMNTYFMRVLTVDVNLQKEGSDILINKAKANREVFEYVVRNRFDFFNNAPYPELLDVAIHIADEYVVKDSAQWDDKGYVQKAVNAVKMANLNPVGSIATNLKLQDVAGQYISLHDVQAHYTVLYFYNPTCGTCSILTPMLWDIYKKYMNKGLKVYATYVDQTKADWAPYITEHKYNWINVWDPDGSEKLYEKYDIHAIPTIYLLDSKKNIILKDVTIDQLDERLSNLLITK